MKSMSVEAVLRKAKELRASGIDHEAIELLTEALRDHTDARLYFSRGIQFDLIHRPEKALEDFTRAIELDRTNAMYYLYRGSVLSHSLERDGEAVSDFEKVLELEPENIEAHWECCLSLLILGRPNRAWEYAVDALTLAPGEDLTHFCLGEAQMSLQHFDDAIQSFTRAMELDPGQTHYADALNRAREKEQENRTYGSRQ